MGYRDDMRYEYTQLYIPIGKKGWKELGSALVDLPSEGWELFMAVPIIGLTSIIPGISGSRTKAIIHYFRRPVN
jgi:hypothetical protein